MTLIVALTIFKKCRVHQYGTHLKKIGIGRETLYKYIHYLTLSDVFVNQLEVFHKLNTTKQGDFLVDEKYIFKVGGKNKSFNQIKDIENSFVVADDIEIGFKNKIPLWVFGFLY